MAAYVQNIEASLLMGLASQTALAKAISDQMELVEDWGDLNLLARMCANMCGGAVDTTINWKVIRPRHAELTIDYYRMLTDACGEGPTQIEYQRERMLKWRDGYYADIEKKFAQARAHNNQMINNALAGFQTARAVRIAALGTLALLSGVGGMVGAGGTIAAFGVETGVAGLTFSQGLLIAVGYKAAYNVATVKPEEIKAVVINNGLKDGGQEFWQEGAEKAAELLFYDQLKSWAKELHLGSTTETKIDLLRRQLANKMKAGKPNAKAIGKLERQIARRTEEHAARAGARKTASAGQKIVSGLPVVWLAMDMYDIYKEADADMQNL